VISKILLTAFVGGAIVFALSAAEKVQAARGKELFIRRCSGCHSPDLNKEGPRLRGVYGRKAAGIPGFGYSDALKNLDVRWNDATLEQWLKDPATMAPDTDMAFKLTDGEERKAVIEYLKTLGPQ
jgi:cytochrome c